MYRTIALIFAFMLLWGMIKYRISILIKEDKQVLIDKYNRYGPFYKIDWGDKDVH